MATQVDNSMKMKMKMKVAAAWIFVGIPLTWGVLQTLANAMKLFQ